MSRCLHGALGVLGGMAALALGCQKQAPGASTPAAPAPALVAEAPRAQPAPPSGQFNRLARADFNRLAVENDAPLFWRNDDDGDKDLDPDELAITWGHKFSERRLFVEPAGFTDLFRGYYADMLKTPDESQLPPEERARRAAVRAELAQGRPTLIESDFSKAAPAEVSLLRRLLDVARTIEQIYMKQKGTYELSPQPSELDLASRALFRRNQGPFCVAPKTEADPACFALRARVPRVVGLYPRELQADKKFCEKLERQPNGKALMDHFSVVVPGPKPNSFAAQKYSQAYASEVESIARLLEAAAGELGGTEAALKKYLVAAAGSFRSDDWEPANEAWVAMSPANSKYYLRVGPDEVYYEPCAWKAGFGLTFARINPDSAAFLAMLDPIKQELENEVASLAGRPYRVRDVKFKLPDFIDVVLNAGDARAPLGGTKGQSLPNWGGVARRGGRTVLMTNIATDADSQAETRKLMSSLFCKATLAKASTDPKISTLSVVLHEAAHNLGPSHDYAVNGKPSEAAFGGGLAATLEELKAQTAALYFPRRLVEKRLISGEDAERGHIQDVAWAFGHVAQGMYTAEGEPRHYSQLASIQLGRLAEARALVWKADELAGNDQDRGCFELDFASFDGAVSALMKEVLEIKAKGERARAEKLKQQWVDADNAWKQTRASIAERWLRAPKASFVYSIREPP
jgi:hypothetical protein